MQTAQAPATARQTKCVETMQAAWWMRIAMRRAMTTFTPSALGSEHAVKAIMDSTGYVAGAVGESMGQSSFLNVLRADENARNRLRAADKPHRLSAPLGVAHWASALLFTDSHPFEMELVFSGFCPVRSNLFPLRGSVLLRVLNLMGSMWMPHLLFTAQSTSTTAFVTLDPWARRLRCRRGPSLAP